MPGMFVAVVTSQVLLMASPVAAAGQYDVVVSNGTATRFEPAPDQPAPLYTVDRKTLEKLAITGTTALALVPGVGTAYVTTVAGVKTFIKAESLGLEMLDARSDKLQKIRVEFLDPRIEKLKAIKDSGQSLRNSAEAQQILNEIRGEAQQPGGAWSFAARSLFSTDAVYIVVRDKAVSKFRDFVGARLAKLLKLETRARVIWQNDVSRRLSRKLIVRHWDTLQTRGQLAKQWTNALTKEAVKLALGLLYDKKLKAQYDVVYRRALANHPSTVAPITSRPAPTPLEIRAVMALAPAAMMPVMAAPAPIQAFVVPVAVQTYDDPVASAAKTENQFIQSQQYTTNTSPGNTPSQSTQRSPEPRQSHPAPSMPRMPTSFSGGRGDTLWTR